MNRLLLAILSIAAVSGAAPLSMAQEKTPRQFNNDLEAQVSVSRDQIKVLTGQVGKNASEKYAHADYRAKMRQFAARVNERMAVFDRYLADEMLPALNDDIVNYNSVVNSNDYAASQKAQMLNATLQILNKKIAMITPKYQSQIKELYNIFAEFPATVRANSRDSNEFVSFTTIEGTLIAVPFKLRPSVIFDGINQHNDYSVFQVYVQDLLSEGCKSYSCVTLTAMDYATLLAGIKSKLDKNLTIELADGTVVIILALDLNVMTALRLINNTDYTDDILKLPFDSK